MNENKFRYLLLSPVLLMFFLLSCNNTKYAEIGKDKPVIDDKIVAQTSEITKQDSVKTSTVSKVANTSTSRAQASKLTDTAKFLAGMNLDATSSLAKSENIKAWKAHANFFDKAWVNLEKQQLSKIRKWSEIELKSLNQSKATIFYPFSGPDFLYASSFFPNGSDYVLVGLEPVGEIPDLDKIATSSEMATNLQWLQSSMADVMQLSFFMTKKMAKDFKETKLKGVLPILFVFLARTNNSIVDVQYVGLDKEGAIAVQNSSSKGSSTDKSISGVKIDFLPPGESQPRSLYYFSTDLSNDGLKKTPFATFVKKLPSPVTYLKAASYLMYQDGFNDIRDLILSQSSALLQDDSGMPVKYLDRSKWNLKFYGSYTQPISLFANRYQADLRKIYASDKTIAPLDFGIGYRYRVNESNLMLATSQKR